MAKITLGLAFFALFFLGWGVATLGGFVNKTFLADPITMVVSGWRLLILHGFYVDIGVTIWRVIGGFVIGGSSNKTVMVRARGPSLTAFGITNALANPALQLVRASDEFLPAGVFVTGLNTSRREIDDDCPYRRRESVSRRFEQEP